MLNNTVLAILQHSGFYTDILQHLPNLGVTLSEIFLPVPTFTPYRGSWNYDWARKTPSGGSIPRTPAASQDLLWSISGWG